MNWEYIIGGIVLVIAAIVWAEIKGMAGRDDDGEWPDDGGAA
ncbi:hypothetical protein GCM10011348_46060 [Marinobacterium nitratireducens]|uniref:Uncharacterized protein n=1 Tax=Marinobacterium nitratireducens TaxID=518897 RepID=A0A917ZRU2_9GAMM|nr:hypothetical protein [Marinobacterium nitratireducens]GGO89100.1 hypothetical protein GCM10011348_46060 [Marinobacterium nitratireducens]